MTFVIGNTFEEMIKRFSVRISHKAFSSSVTQGTLGMILGRLRIQWDHKNDAFWIILLKRALEHDYVNTVKEGQTRQTDRPTDRTFLQKCNLRQL